MNYKSIDLFAGIGGIRLGFELAFRDKIKTVFVSESDKNAKITYKANFNDKLEIAGDITKIDEKIIPKFDICLAGFPCQAFSFAGSRKGFNDDYKGVCRGTLFLDVARICEFHKPKVIFCENVKGLVNHDKGSTFKIIKNTFEKLGYNVFSKVLNSKDFGVPQNRERNLIIDHRQKDLIPKTHIKGEINKEGIRKMTPREWARLQGFPDDFILPVADVHLYKQLGNSVTVNVIEAIAKKVKEILDQTIT